MIVSYWLMVWLSFLYPCFFMSSCSINFWKRSFDVPTLTTDLNISTYSSFSFALHIVKLIVCCKFIRTALSSQWIIPFAFIWCASLLMELFFALSLHFLLLIFPFLFYFNICIINIFFIFLLSICLYPYIRIGFLVDSIQLVMIFNLLWNYICFNWLT